MATATTQSASGARPPVQKRDFRQEVTDRIVNMLENGVAPWQKPWEPGNAPLGMPTNPTTEKAYRGGNAIHLMATALHRGYEDPRWMTYKQAADQGWQVRRGEKGTQIEFWEVKRTARDQESEPEAHQGNSSGADERSQSRSGSRLIHRIYTVFNASQIDGVPTHKPKELTAFEVTQAGEQILNNSGAKISHDQADRAFYSRASDSIHLPSKEAFRDAAGYYGTALHELAHWTGHPSRLNRQTLNESYRFGDTNYAKEELRAELASVFLAAERGIPHDPEQHAAYVGSWIKSLREDKNEIFRAAHDASAATDFLLSLERDRSVADGILMSGPARQTTGEISREPDIEDETARLERDRENLEEHDGESDKKSAVRETSEITSHFEPGSAAVSLTAKQAGIERRTTVDTLAPTDRSPVFSQTDPLAAAQEVTAKVFGTGVRTVAALTESGTYKGPIIGDTDLYTVQLQSAGLSVAHPKNMLDRQPGLGDNVSINYSKGRGAVRENHERARTQELGR